MTFMVGKKVRNRKRKEERKEGKEGGGRKERRKEEGRKILHLGSSLEGKERDVFLSACKLFFWSLRTMSRGV